MPKETETEGLAVALSSGWAGAHPPSPRATLALPACSLRRVSSVLRALERRNGRHANSPVASIRTSQAPRSTGDYGAARNHAHPAANPKPRAGCRLACATDHRLTPSRPVTCAAADGHRRVRRGPARHPQDARGQPPASARSAPRLHRRPFAPSPRPRPSEPPPHAAAAAEPRRRAARLRAGPGTQVNAACDATDLVAKLRADQNLYQVPAPRRLRVRAHACARDGLPGCAPHSLLSSPDRPRSHRHALSTLSAGARPPPAAHQWAAMQPTTPATHPQTLP